jgi:hypothetical protein
VFVDPFLPVQSYSAHVTTRTKSIHHPHRYDVRSAEDRCNVTGITVAKLAPPPLPSLSLSLSLARRRSVHHGVERPVDALSTNGKVAPRTDYTRAAIGSR